MGIDLLFLLPVLLLFPALKNTDNENQAYISADTGLRMRGLAAATVVIHHLSQRVESGYLRYFFWFIGVFPVSVFLFYAGYGFMKRCCTDQNYGKGYLRRRLIPVLVPYLFLYPIYYLIGVIEGTPYTVSQFAEGIVSGDPVLLFTWYVFLIIFWYFWCAAMIRICGQDQKKLITGGILFVVIWCVVCSVLSYGIWWYNTAHILVMGMLWYSYEDKILNLIREKRNLVMTVSGICLALTYATPYLFRFQYPVFFVSTVSFIILMNCILMKYIPGNAAVVFLGKISYELYLIHGALITLLRGTGIFIENDFLFAAMVIFISVPLAFVFYQCFEKLLKRKNRTS